LICLLNCHFISVSISIPCPLCVHESRSHQEFEDHLVQFHVNKNRMVEHRLDLINSWSVFDTPHEFSIKCPLCVRVFQSHMAFEEHLAAFHVAKYDNNSDGKIPISNMLAENGLEMMTLSKESHESIRNLKYSGDKEMYVYRRSSNGHCRDDDKFEVECRFCKKFGQKCISNKRRCISKKHRCVSKCSKCFKGFIEKDLLNNHNRNQKCGIASLMDQ